MYLFCRARHASLQGYGVSKGGRERAAYGVSADISVFVCDEMFVLHGEMRVELVVVVVMSSCCACECVCVSEHTFVFARTYKKKRRADKHMHTSCACVNL